MKNMAVKLKNTKRIVFIINPNAGLSSKKEIKDKILVFFKKKQKAVTVKFTKKVGDAKEWAEKYSKMDSIESVVAVGGDGTVNEVANGIGISGKKMGIIRGGSGNGLARHLGIPILLKKALEVIYESNSVPMDMMDINNRYSVNVSGVGFDAIVANKFQNVETRGPVSYVRIILTEFSSFKAQDYHIIVDGKLMNIKAYLVSFANSSQFGNNALISKTASVTDGYIDLCIIKPFPKVASPIVIERLMTGRLDSSKYMEVIKAKEIVLKQTSSVYHIDGDAIEGGNILKIKLIHSVLNIIIPKNKINKI